MNSFYFFTRLALVRSVQIMLLGSALLFGSSLQAQALTPDQQAKLTAVESGLKRVQTNYQLAADSAGTGTPTGSIKQLLFCNFRFVLSG